MLYEIHWYKAKYAGSLESPSLPVFIIQFPSSTGDALETSLLGMSGSPA